MEQFAQEVGAVLAAGAFLVLAWKWIKAHPRAVCPDCKGKGEFPGAGGFRDCNRCKRSGRVLRPSLRVAAWFSGGLRRKFADFPR